MFGSAKAGEVVGWRRSWRATERSWMAAELREGRGNIYTSNSSRNS